MNKLAMIVAAVCTVVFSINAENVAKITTFEGNVSVLKKGVADWRDAKPGTPLEVGDQVYTRVSTGAPGYGEPRVSGHPLWRRDGDHARRRKSPGAEVDLGPHQHRRAGRGGGQRAHHGCGRPPST